MRLALRVGATSLLWFGLWLLLVEKFTADELLIGAACALLAGAASEVTWRAHLIALAAKPRLLFQIWRLPWSFLVDTLSIFEVLALHLFTSRKAESLLLSVPFEAGEADDPDHAVRRALAIGYTTMTPNFVVIGIDSEKNTLLYHQIKKSAVPVMTVRLGARP
ncbi:MAG: Na+/H+ antiporter subunit E [Polyangia bacterium]